MQNITGRVGNFWLVAGAASLSLVWLLPNHTLPWTTFHSDTLAAGVLLLFAIWIALRCNTAVAWNLLTVSILLVALLPWAQHFTGKIPIFGVAWINSLYVLGLLLAIRIGEVWDRNGSSQLQDFIFCAVVLASIGSVGVQIMQWLNLPNIGPWTIFANGSNRFYGNLAQPNQLGTLLLLGLLGVSWAHHRKYINAIPSTAIAMLLLLGVALTGSRTAWLNITLMAAGLILHRKQLPSKGYANLVGLLLGYFAVCVLVLPAVNVAMGLVDANDISQYRSLRDPARIQAWKMMIEASLQQPIFGYGWGQLAAANYAVIAGFPGTPGLFMQSHNLFLDFVLWNGYLVGFAMVIGLIAWFIKAFKNEGTFPYLHQLAFLVILMVHAMLEFPLHYAMFLLPFGLMVGAVNNKLGLKQLLKIDTRISNLVLCAVAVAGFWLTVRDYIKVENSFFGLRFELRNIKTDIPKTAPNVMVLNQFTEYFKLARNTPSDNLSSAQLKKMVDIVNVMSGDLLIFRLAQNMALNNRPQDAKFWLVNLCKTREVNCQSMRLKWLAEEDPRIKAVEWPAEFSE